MLGLDYKLNDEVTLYTEYEHADGKDIDTSAFIPPVPMVLLTTFK